MIGTSEVALTDRFVGRQAELEVLSAALQTARGGKPQLVWIDGEPGIGKTAFMRRFLTTIEDAPVLEASGEESETTLDYGVVLQLVAQASATSGWSASAELINTRSPANPFAVGADLLDMLGALQDAAPIAVIAVDDVQWLDASSAGALLFALRRLHGDRVLVVIVSRPDGLGQLGPGWARLLSAGDHVHRISLSGLTAPEVNQLAALLGIGELTPAASERLQLHTAGHPLYVKALLAELPLDRLNLPDRELPAPHSFSATVLARLTGIGADAQNLVAAVAVAGPRCPVAFAAAAAGLGDPLPALEESLAADLLTLTPTQLPEEIAFPHPLVRAAVYDDLSPTRRRALHLACAELASGPAALAHRVAASHGDDDALAGELESAAEIALSAGRLPAGVERLLWASKIAADPVVRERTLLRAVEYLVLAGDSKGAVSQLGAVMACGDSPRRTFAIGLVTAVTGRLAQAEGAFREVMARPDYERYPELHGPVTSALAMQCGLSGNGEEAVELARRALEIPAVSATAATTARQALAVGLLISGRAEEGIASLASASAQRVEPRPFEPELVTTRGNLKVWWGDLAGAVEDLSAVIRWSRAGVPLRSLPNAHCALAQAEYHLGRWDDGLTHADVAVSLGEDNERAWDLPFLHAVAAYLNGARGNWSAATEHVAAARRAFEVAPLPMCAYYASTAAAHLAWVRGDPIQVLDALAPLRVLLSGGPAKGLGQRFAQCMAIEAMLQVGRLDDAQTTLDIAAEWVRDSLEDPTRVEVWRLRALLGQAQQRPKQAQVAFERGKAAAGAVHAPLATGLLELAHGQFLRKQGNRRAAIAELRAARERFAGLGAHPFMTRCDLELTACGVRSRDRREENRYGLTAREEVVARLVASGKSNREVADELYLSTKAVEYHLGNVFAKVNIRSRHDLAGRLA